MEREIASQGTDRVAGVSERHNRERTENESQEQTGRDWRRLGCWRGFTVYELTDLIG